MRRTLGEHYGEHCGETKRQQGPQHQEHGSALQNPTSYALHGSTSNHHSASGEYHCNLAYHPHCIEEQEEELQQANAENTAEKLSGNKATIVKNTAQLSKIPPYMLSTPWCTAILKRFGPRYIDLITQLEACHYTRKDAANKKDATSYVQEVLRITKGLDWNDHVKSGINTAFHHFESSLQQTLDPPSDLNSFIDQVQIRQQGWFQIYAGYGKPRPPDPYPRPQQSYQPRPQQQQQYKPSYPYRQSQPQVQPQPQPQPARPQVYWGEEEDYVYDAPADSYHMALTYHPAGHTPRRHGNTHDGSGNEAMVHWASAGDDHRCTHEGCTHYH
ncbi:hypothetical protein HO173_005485 [Letharia columbiana]|uniref:Uncharacterized protein n=1 Tax=Letharia columbiana TaxID=112416 RepID=A0A8H6FX78_9LECA|nr:uncharacterized protein HO173_005485 [Letharia columbiana]KAF6236393.1 hypothetical protein HO173_005485 [Letharia columbiana]